MANQGLRVVNSLNVLPLDGLWSGLEGVPADERMAAALSYAGCDFYDEERRFVKGSIVALAGIGGMPVAHEGETDEAIAARIEQMQTDSREMMGSSAAFSYLNSGEKAIDALYAQATDLGHFSMGHTVQVNLVIAGITEATELELGLQRDLVHFSKITNARTKVQNRPPVVVRNPDHVPVFRRLYDQMVTAATDLRTDTLPDTLEIVNGLFPINKATMLLISGDLSNMRKLTQLRDDAGKERELRDVADMLHAQLSGLWPEIFRSRSPEMTTDKERTADRDDYFANGLLEKLDVTDPIFAAYEAQDVSNKVGFDFDDFQSVVPRALDEIRETKEAYAETGPEGREHFGDEVADIMFSLINLARHAGMVDLPAFEDVLANVPEGAMRREDTIAVVEEIGARIAAAAAVESSDPSHFDEVMHHLFTSGMHDSIRIARAHGFNPQDLLRENVRKYLIRCQAIEQLAGADGKSWKDLASQNEIIIYWKRAKSLLNK